MSLCRAWRRHWELRSGFHLESRDRRLGHRGLSLCRAWQQAWSVPRTWLRRCVIVREGEGDGEKSRLGGNQDEAGKSARDGGEIKSGGMVEGC